MTHENSEKFLQLHSRTPIRARVTPLIVPAGRRGQFRLEPEPGELKFAELDGRSLRYCRIDGRLSCGETACWDEMESVAHELREDGVLCFEMALSGEGEHRFVLFSGEHAVLEFRIYSLEPDLFRLRPFKGDLHLHSNRSDGRESVAQVASIARFRGLDFIGITDHRRYFSSAEAAELMCASGDGLLICPGEEVHLPGAPGRLFESGDPCFRTRWVWRRSPVHLVNFGGGVSVNDLADQDEGRFRREVEEAARELPETLPVTDRWSIASTEWAFRRIRENGGLAILSHPYWQVNGRTAISEAVLESLIARRNFDALEIVNGSYAESNFLAIARYRQAREEGGRFSGIAVTDGHRFEREELQKMPYTLIFTPSLSRESIIEAVRAGYCCGAMPAAGEPLPLLCGNFRLVRYGYFLLREYFPRHDALCRQSVSLPRPGDWSSASPGMEEFSAARQTVARLQEEELRRVFAAWKRPFPGNRPENPAGCD